MEVDGVEFDALALSICYPCNKFSSTQKPRNVLLVFGLVGLPMSHRLQIFREDRRSNEDEQSRTTALYRKPKFPCRHNIDVCRNQKAAQKLRVAMSATGLANNNEMQRKGDSPSTKCNRKIHDLFIQPFNVTLQRVGKNDGARTVQQ